jgi:hypothetical protein
MIDNARAGFTQLHFQSAHSFWEACKPEKRCGMTASTRAPSVIANVAQF